MAKIVKWSRSLSTTEPFNNIGLVKVRQDNTSEIWEIRITENGRPYDFSKRGIKEVYFNTKFSRDRVVEQRAEIIDAKKGIIQYTMNNYDMQQAKPFQAAYFEFISSDGSYVDSTQTFFYHIIPSKYQACTEGSTYIIRLEELFKLYQDYMSKGIGDWEKFVESNREILESIDPGGKILTELIDARGEYDSLKDKLYSLEQRKSISYKEFGVNSEKKYFNRENRKYYLDEAFTEEYTKDDSIKIKECHDYANKHGLNIVNNEGCYLFRFGETPIIETSIDNHGAELLVDESSIKSTNVKGIYYVKSPYEEIDIMSEIDKVTLLKECVKGNKKMTTLKKYRNCFCRIVDKNHYVGKRVGANASIGVPMQDWFYITEKGYIKGEMSWTFSDITHVYVRPTTLTPIIIKNSLFKINGNLKVDSIYSYVENGILTDRDRVTFKDVYFELDGVEDDSTNPSRGFINNLTGYNIRLINVTMPARKTMTIDGVEKGNYSYSANTVSLLKWDNVNIAGDLDDYSGVGTNYMKDWYIRNSNVNKIDCHFYVWNLKINDSYIGNRGLSVTGGGRLEMNNVEVNHIDYIHFRGDYGARWDGDIIINDGRLRVSDITNSNILNDNKYPETQIIRWPITSVEDFGYPVPLARDIYIDGFTFDFTDVPKNAQKANIFKFPDVYQTANNNIYFPRILNVKNVFKSGRSRGVDLFTLKYLGELRMGRAGAFSVRAGQVHIKPNSVWEFDTIEMTEYIDNSKGIAKHLLLDVQENNSAYTNLSVLPKISIKNCQNISIGVQSSICDLLVSDSTVNTVDGYSGGKGRSKLVFTNVEFSPNLSTIANPALNFIDNDVTYNHCLFNEIKVNDKIDFLQTTLAVGGVFLTNKDTTRMYVGKHNGSMLSKDLVTYIRTSATQSPQKEKVETLLKELRCSTRNYDYVNQIDL